MKSITHGTVADGVMAWPRVEIALDEAGPARVIINGATQLVERDGDDARSPALAVVTRVAQDLDRPVRVTATDGEGTWLLVVHPDGSIGGEDVPVAVAAASSHPVVSAARAGSGAELSTTRGPATAAADGAATLTPVPALMPLTRSEARASFLGGVGRDEPASDGWRGIATRLGFRMSPGAAERAEREEVRAVSQHWPGPRTIAVVNGKGGASKTPTTILLAAVLARYGGAGVLAWDNNQTRGTLGWRTEQGQHEATLLDLLPAADELLGTGAQSADLARFVHHQTRDRYDVLRSKPLALATEQRVQPCDVDAIHAVAAKYYRLIVIDSGNDESDPMWRRMIDHADQIVVATTTRDDHAEAGALLLEGLSQTNERAAALAGGAVAIVSQADPRATRSDVRRVLTGYEQLARETVAIPWDPAMVDGVLQLGSLKTRTARAWLSAAAAVARGL